MITLLFIGFLFGVRHALEADHLAAVATISSQSKSLTEGLRHGVAWGVGHSFTLLVICGFVFSIEKSIPQNISSVLELAVGFALLWLAFDVFRRLHRQQVHVHPHRHADGTTHIHLHSHHELPSHDHSHQRFPARALLLGLIHGMAGSAALVLIVLQSTISFWWGIVYIVLFGVGSILGMAILSVVIALPLVWSNKRSTKLIKTIQVCAGIVSAVLGAHLIYQIGYVDGFLL
ncbi:MAG: sulfite exporter TauE/SafE family protein [Gammaproteobacteria bacterium]|nr:sulfite exporter TauE/SafE family protein [Gammaproteobacteria bacterium]